MAAFIAFIIVTRGFFRATCAAMLLVVVTIDRARDKVDTRTILVAGEHFGAALGFHARDAFFACPLYLQHVARALTSSLVAVVVIATTTDGNCTEPCAKILPLHRHSPHFPKQ